MAKKPTLKKLLILTSGGDAPGMNAAIRSAVRTALHKGFQIWGCEMGYVGLIENKLNSLDEKSVANCIQRGGTILKAGRSEPFLKKEVRAQCIATLKKRGIGGLIILGGNGSFQGAQC